MFSIRSWVRRWASVLATAAVIFLTAVISGTAVAPARADTSAMTVTGASPAWDEINNQPMSDLPTATVSQTENLVDQTVQVSWTHFSPTTNDPYNPTTPVPGIYYGGSGVDLYPVWVMECRGTDPNDFLTATTPECYLTSAGRTDGPGGLGNSVYAVTNPDGSGQVSFHVENAQTNSVLGCDPTHPCSIVVLPSFGGRQDPSNPTDCADHSLDYPTEANGYQNDPTTLASDNMFGQACSWANRLVIPLHFAVTPTSCPRTADAFGSAGSPMLSRAMSQWQAGWCRGGSALSFSYNSTNNEYQARTSFLNGSGALTSSTDVAFTSQPGDGARKHTYAPIANTDIAVAFVVDNPSTGQTIKDLTLNARLMAKLLTQSYAVVNYACPAGSDPTKQGHDCDPAVAGNPSSIFVDPEFLHLNPSITATDYSTQNLAVGEFFPTVVSGNSDLTYTLTSWIESDADARAFLAGLPDKWGTHVNTYYKGIEYPTAALQELDPGYTDPAAPAGNGTMQNAWQPVNGLDTVGRLLVGNSTSALSNVQTVCSAPPCSFPRVIDQLGARALFAVLDQGTASAYDFPTAHLVNAAGVAVAPTTESVSAGLAAMKVNADGVTRSPSFAGAGPQAYPLSVVDYAMVPTCGVSAGVANGIQSFLAHVAASQTYGVQPGTIAPGYLALTTGQLAQLNSAAAAVSSSPCSTAIPPVPTTGALPTSTAAAPIPGSGGSGGGAGSGASPTDTAGAGTRPARTATSAASPSLAPAAYGYKPTAGATAMGWVLPGLLITGAALLLGGPGMYLAVSTGAASAATAGTRRLWRLIRRWP